MNVVICWCNFGFSYFPCRQSVGIMEGDVMLDHGSHVALNCGGEWMTSLIRCSSQSVQDATNGT